VKAAGGQWCEGGWWLVAGGWSVTASGWLAGGCLP